MKNDSVDSTKKAYICKCGEELNVNLFCMKCKRFYILDEKNVIRELILERKHE